MIGTTTTRLQIPSLRSASREVGRRRLASIARRFLLLSVALPILLFGVPALAESEFDDGYDPTESGHPLRIVAYMLHPVGVILDTLIFRPAWWLGTHEPIKTLVGNTD